MSIQTELAHIQLQIEAQRHKVACAESEYDDAKKRLNEHQAELAQLKEQLVRLRADLTAEDYWERWSLRPEGEWHDEMDSR